MDEEDLTKEQLEALNHDLIKENNDLRILVIGLLNNDSEAIEQANAQAEEWGIPYDIWEQARA